MAMTPFSYCCFCYVLLLFSLLFFFYFFQYTYRQQNHGDDGDVLTSTSTSTRLLFMLVMLLLEYIILPGQKSERRKNKEKTKQNETKQNKRVREYFNYHINSMRINNSRIYYSPSCVCVCCFRRYDTMPATTISEQCTSNVVVVTIAIFVISCLFLR